MHLVRRFFGHLTARPLGPSEQAIVRSHLDGDCAALFFSQQHQDQRHAFAVASAVGFRAELAETALLHDVGKTASRLGAFARSLATILGALRLPMPTRWRVYLDHGVIGATMLESAGASAFTIAFSAHHPGVPPEGIDHTLWDTLADADDS